MPLRPCLDCGTLTPASRCPRHSKRDRTTPGRGGASTVYAFRDAVLTAAGHRCQFVNGHGARCTVTDPERLEAHHLRPLRDGGTNDPANGAALCRHHHRIVERATAQVARGR